MTTRRQGQQPQEPQGMREVIESKIKESSSTIKEKLTHEGVYDPRMEEFLGLPFGLGGLYISEDKPVEYGDCLRWPESCKSGGLKSFFGNIKLGFGIPRVSFSKCEMIIMIPMGLGPISFPHLSLSYRKPNCEEEPKEPKDPEEPRGENPSPATQTFLIKDDYTRSRIEVTATTVVAQSPWMAFAKTHSIIETWAAIVNAPTFLWVVEIKEKMSGLFPQLPSLSKEEVIRLANQGLLDIGVFADPRDIDYKYFSFFTKDKPNDIFEEKTDFFLQEPGSNKSRREFTTGQSTHYYPFFEAWNEPGRVGQIWQTISHYLEIKIDNDPAILIELFPSIPHPQIKPMDNCCRKTLKLIKELHKNAAISRRPFTLPRNMIQPGAKPDKKVELRDQADDYEFLIRYLDRSIGALPIENQIEDADPNTPGDQNMLMRHESLGAALQSLIQIEFSANAQSSSTQTSSNSTDSPQPLATNELITNLLIRAMYAIGGIYKVVAQNSLELREMGEFLGYKSSEKTENLRLPFNPIAKILQQMDGGNNTLSEKQLEAFMEICPVKVSYTENEDRETLVSLFYKALTELSSIRAAFVSRVKDKKGFDQALDGVLLTTQISQLVLLRDIKKAMGTMKEAEFEKWFAELEKRYTEGMSPVATDNDEEFQSPTQNSPRFRVVEKPQTEQ